MECLDGQKKSAAEAYIEKKLKLFFPDILKFLLELVLISKFEIFR
jgi:hypothetical protein